MVSFAVALFIASAAAGTLARPVIEPRGTDTLIPRKRGRDCKRRDETRGWYIIEIDDTLDDIAADFGPPNDSDTIALESNIAKKDFIIPASTLFYSTLCAPNPSSSERTAKTETKSHNERLY